MQFSEDSQHNFFFSQPHQPFFVLAFVNAIATMLIVLLSYNDIIHLALSTVGFHIYALTYLMLTPAFLAFLFTTFPKFTSTSALKKTHYIRIFSLFYMGSAIFLLGSIVTPVFSGIAVVIIFIGHLMGVLVLRKIYKTTTMEDKQDVFWILLAMSFGLLSHFLFLIAAFFYEPLMGLSTEISVYLYIFLLTFSVAQRMVPFFSHSMTEKNIKLLPIVFLLLIFHILLEGTLTNASFIIDLILAYVIGKEILRWKLQFPNPNPLLWILHTALYWVPVGFLLGAVSNFITLVSGTYFLALDTHVILLGFIVTILIGFGTRVTLGHSGNTMQADYTTTLLFYWTQVVVILRILTSFAVALGFDMMFLFNLSMIAWIILFVFWSLKFFAVLIKGKKLT